MRINDVAPRVTYTATALQTVFTVPFEFLLNEDLFVTLNGTVITLAASPTLVTQYSVIGESVEGGGSITLGAGATAGDQVTIYRNMAFDLQTVFPLGGPFLVTQLNDELARYMLLMKQLDDDSDRSIRVPVADTTGEAILPSATDRANKTILFDGLGNLGVTALASATVGNASANLVQSSSGNTLRSLADRADHFPVLQDFGGVNDGVTDNVAAFAAVDTASVPAIYLPAGTYYVAATTSIAAKVIFGSGAIMSAPTGQVVTLSGGYDAYEGETVLTGAGSYVYANSAEAALTKAFADTLPIGDIALPSELNNQLSAEPYWNGSKVDYVANPYDMIDFTKFTAAINHYYVNYTNGDNANAGTSTGSGNSWKTFDHAIVNATSPAVIHLEDDIVGYLSSGISTKQFTGLVKIIGEGSSGRTIIAGMRESYTVASFSWAWSGSAGAFVSTTASAKQYRSMVDGNYRNAQGIPRPMTYAGDQATCETTPGTFFYDTGTTYLYVHMWDGRTPDPLDGWIYGEGPYDFEIQQGGDTSDHAILVENCEFISNLGPTGAGAGVRYRPITTGSPSAARFGMRNCLTYGSNDNGFEVYDAGICVLDNCHTAYNRVDGFNYHSFVTANPDGEFTTIYEHDCTAFHSGWAGWDDQQALSASSNGSTSHDSMHILRTNTVAGITNGSVIADVNGVLSVNLNVRASQPDTGGTASPNACFWHEKYNGSGTSKIMFLWGCAAHSDGNANTLLITNQSQAGGTPSDGEVRVKYWRGEKSSQVTGTLYDWAGAAL